MKEIVLLLHNVRSVHNVGSIFRTADAAGVAKIFLCGYTPAPLDRFGRERKDITKVSLGAEKSVTWQSARSANVLLKKLKREGFHIYALEQDKKAIDYKKVKLEFPAALVLGNEVGGVPQAILNRSEKIIEIPMKGKKESLNVSVAAGIALFRLLKI